MEAVAAVDRAQSPRKIIGEAETLLAGAVWAAHRCSRELLAQAAALQADAAAFKPEAGRLNSHSGLAQDEELKEDEKGEEDEEDDNREDDYREEGEEERGGEGRVGTTQPAVKETRKRTADAGSAPVDGAASSAKRNLTTTFVPLVSAAQQYRDARNEYETHLGDLGAMIFDCQSRSYFLVDATKQAEMRIRLARTAACSSTLLLEAQERFEILTVAAHTPPRQQGFSDLLGFGDEACQHCWPATGIRMVQVAGCHHDRH